MQSNDRDRDYYPWAKRECKHDSNTLYRKYANAIANEQLLEMTQERAEREEAIRLDNEQFQNAMELMDEQDMLAQMSRDDDFEYIDPRDYEDDDFDDYEYEQTQRRREQAYLENDENWV